LFFFWTGILVRFLGLAGFLSTDFTNFHEFFPWKGVTNLFRMAMPYDWCTYFVHGIFARFSIMSVFFKGSTIFCVELSFKRVVACLWHALYSFNEKMIFNRLPHKKWETLLKYPSRLDFLIFIYRLHRQIIGMRKYGKNIALP
jgi:hypothetical protein